MVRILTTGLVVLMSGVAVGSETQAPAIPAQIEEMLWWLPADTETVQVTQLSANGRGPLVDIVAPAGGASVPAGPSFAETLTRFLKAARVKATLGGSRRFRPPKGLGSILYEGATIVRFAATDDDAPRLMADLKARAVKTERFEGVEILELQDTLEQDIWTFSIAMPMADTLVIATSRGYLNELLRRRSTRASTRAVPGDLPEWHWVDVNAPFWALRHYSHDLSDFTQPFAAVNFMGFVDAGASGLTVHVNADGRTVVVHYISQGARAEEIARKFWGQKELGATPIVRRVARDAVEVRLVVKDADQLGYFLFFVTAGALGHVIFV